MEINYRLGNFFILLGLALLLMFWMTTQGPGSRPVFSYFFFGALSLAFGIWKYVRNRPEKEQAERFRLAKRLFKWGKKK